MFATFRMQDGSQRIAQFQKARSFPDIGMPSLSQDVVVQGLIGLFRWSFSFLFSSEPWFQTSSKQGGSGFHVGRQTAKVGFRQDVLLKCRSRSTCKAWQWLAVSSKGRAANTGCTSCCAFVVVVVVVVVLFGCAGGGCCDRTWSNWVSRARAWTLNSAACACHLLAC